MESQQTDINSKKRKIRSCLTLVLLFLLFGITYKAYTVWNQWMQPVAVSGPAQMFTVLPHSSFSRVARDLESQGLIRSHIGFSLLAWYRKAMTRIQAGEYRLSPSMSPEEILNNLVRGRTFQHVVTIPEGYNMYQIADLLSKAGLADRTKFLAAARNRDFLKKWRIPGDSAEGFLYPDTYFLSRGLKAREILDIFVSRFWRVWNKEAFGRRAAKLKMSVFKVVTLASIVEKEAMVPEERPVIAAVFLNRLKRGMELQTDPTVKYILYLETNGKRHRTRWSRLRYKKSPYNTYMIKGLPKGPISNPGAGSIRAVLYPAKVDYLYFVSMNNGHHYFSNNLAEHNRAVYKYQKRHYRRKKTVRLRTTVKSSVTAGTNVSSGGSGSSSGNMTTPHEKAMTSANITAGSQANATR